MNPALRSLRQLLLSPAAFFDERPPAETLPVAAGLVVLFAICLVGSLLLVGSMLAETVEGTVTVDNPDRPPERFCDDFADGSDSLIYENCDEPATIERDAGEMIREAAGEYIGYALIGPFVLWFVGGGVLYAAGRLAGGTPSFVGALALAGWAALPEFLRLAVALATIRIALADVTISDPERAADVVEAALAQVEPVLLVASLVTVCWQWYLLTGGLAREADVSREAAAVGAGVPLGLFFFLGLA